jgi:hypothetical protein
LLSECCADGVEDRAARAHNSTIRRSRASMPPRNPRTRAPSLRRLHSIALTPARPGSITGRRVVPISGWQRGLRERRPHPVAAGLRPARHLSECASLQPSEDARGVAPRLSRPTLRAGRPSDQGEAGVPSPVPGDRRPAHAGLCRCRRAAPQPAAARGHPARTRHDRS